MKKREERRMYEERLNWLVNELSNTDMKDFDKRNVIYKEIEMMYKLIDGTKFHIRAIDAFGIKTFLGLFGMLIETEVKNETNKTTSIFEETKTNSKPKKESKPVQHHVNERAVNDEGKFAHIECWKEDNENHYMYRTYWDKESTGKWGLAGGSGSHYEYSADAVLNELRHQGFKGHIQIDEYAREPRS